MGSRLSFEAILLRQLLNASLASKGSIPRKNLSEVTLLTGEPKSGDLWAIQLSLTAPSKIGILKEVLHPLKFHEYNDAIGRGEFVDGCAWASWIPRYHIAAARFCDRLWRQAQSGSTWPCVLAPFFCTTLDPRVVCRDRPKKPPAVVWNTFLFGFDRPLHLKVFTSEENRQPPEFFIPPPDHQPAADELELPSPFHHDVFHHWSEQRSSKWPIPNVKHTHLSTSKRAISKIPSPPPRCRPIKHSHLCACKPFSKWQYSTIRSPQPQLSVGTCFKAKPKPKPSPFFAEDRTVRQNIKEAKRNTGLNRPKKSIQSASGSDF
ncbi:hypothetical protein K402DRAFT_10430 [Aulographum hederae CBS 113979]|uniref:Uncharacterized protein n=1 Tax=Aulographum hederae CBS 113979 TaxID=1176131 RepID=A0A6G1HHW3_9PEZI|nr:hypothetical protein K402DRAFT_10430 [Aulographum hederae CBS 113979]